MRLQSSVGRSGKQDGEVSRFVTRLIASLSSGLQQRNLR